MTAFRVRVVASTDGCRRIRISGDVDLTVAELLRTVIIGPSEQAHLDTVDVDFTDVTFLDMAGVNALLDARRTLLANGRRLRVRGVQGVARQVLEITGLLALLDGKDDGLPSSPDGKDEMYDSR